MKCVIPGAGIRAFGKAVHCLAKIGEDLYLETSIDRLYLKTVNPSRSGYVCFEFDKSFFHTYSSGSHSNKDVFSCKIMAKSFLSVFRALTSLEKSVDHCKMSIDQESFKVVLIFHCKHGIVKTHQLGYEDCDTLKAVYSKETCPNKLTGISMTLSEVVVNFPNSLDEVTLIAKTDKVQLKNYVEDPNDANRVPLTEVILFSDEFEDLVIQVETSITFCLKELRAVLNFSDSVGDNLSISFETPGKPVILSIDNNPHYTADIVLATLVESTENGEPVNNEQSFTKSTQSINTTKSHMTTKRDSYWNHSTTNDRDISMSYSTSKVTTEPVRSGNHDVKTNEQHISMKEVGERRGERRWVSGEGVPVVSSIKRLSQNQETQLERTGSVQCNLMDSLFVTDERELNVERLSHHVIAGNKGKGPVGKNYIPKGKNTSLTDHDFFADFPHRDKFINKSQIPVTPIFQTQALSQTPEEPIHNLLPLPAQIQDDDITTQDSIIDSSGFVPSTPPPAKKFKSLFASDDIFGGSEERDYILAPDSEDED